VLFRFSKSLEWLFKVPEKKITPIIFLRFRLGELCQNSLKKVIFSYNTIIDLGVCMSCVKLAKKNWALVVWPPHKATSTT